MDDRQREALEQLFEEAVLWGLELEPTYRVLAATIEPTHERHPQREVADRRLQVLFFPVSTLLASLRHVSGPKDGVVETFAADQLLDVVTALDGPSLARPRFGRPEPGPGEWAPTWSLEGRSNAPDGRRHSVHLSVQAGPRGFDLYARFDDTEIRDVVGREVAVPVKES